MYSPTIVNITWNSFSPCDYAANWKQLGPLHLILIFRNSFFTFKCGKKHNKIYLNYFKVYSSVILSVVTLLYNRSPELFHLL